MTLTELAALYRRCYRTIQRERFMRQEVFKSQPAKLRQKLAEMDQLMADVEAMKEELKRRIGEAEPAQAALPGMPEARRKEYA